MIKEARFFLQILQHKQQETSVNEMKICARRSDDPGDRVPLQESPSVLMWEPRHRSARLKKNPALNKAASAPR